ncbi:MAG: endonuclease MutS2 [Paenibacillaceae bacterium]|nr:endonuclease MutS2 [Paenibacillaceae bacterium]
MEQKALQAVQFDIIVQHVRAHAQTPMGQTALDVVRPSSEDAPRLLAQTDEAVLWYAMHGLPSFDEVHDVTACVAHALIGGVLALEQLADVCTTLAAMQRVRTALGRFVAKHDAPLCHARYASLSDWRPMETFLRTIIDEHGHVRDEASEQLARVRNAIRAKERAVRALCEAMLRDKHVRTVLQEPIITVRNDRFVLPIKAEARSSFDGIIHDQSASGATVYIEPQAIVAANNDVRRLKVEEQQEIVRILQQCSERIAQVGEALIADVRTIGDIDVWCAKARYAAAIRGTRPHLDPRGRIALRRARHPLIAPDRVVAIDVVLGDDDDTMLITGPNTGGKTVTLKTVGLLHAMAHAGMYIPAQEGSSCAHIDALFVDIGDEQDIAHNLSTFSSHMRNIVAMLHAVTSRSLVLLDEVGVGTDPTEGAALAIAIIDYIKKIGSTLIATTHDRAVKAYAYAAPHTITASMAFDPDALAPTYALRIGVPGSSHGLTIASRLGLPEAVTAHARAQLTVQDRHVDQMIDTLDRLQREAHTAREEANALREEAQARQRDIEALQEQLHATRAQLIQDARMHARRIVAQAKHEAKNVLAALQADIEGEKAQERASRIRKHVRALDDAVDDVPDVSQHKQAAFCVGALVRVLPHGLCGTIVDIHGDEAIVQIGVMKTKTHRNQLADASVQQLQAPSVKSPRPPSHSDAQRAVRTHIDVRGMNAEDALVEIDRWLDEVLRDGVPFATIIHGKGTGVLRTRVLQFVRAHRSVASVRLGAHGEGGDGVTVVALNV